MHSTSVIADSKVNIEYVSFFILRFWIIGITKAEETPPKINPINNECSKSKPKSIDINAIAIEEMKKLYNVISIPLPSPFTKEIRSILNAPSNNKNNNANVVKNGAIFSSELGRISFNA